MASEYVTPGHELDGRSVFCRRWALADSPAPDEYGYGDAGRRFGGGAASCVVFVDTAGRVRAGASRPAGAPLCTIKDLYLVRF